MNTENKVSIVDLRKATTSAGRSFKAIDKQYRQDIFKSSVELGKAINKEVQADKKKKGLVLLAIEKRTGIGNSTLRQCSRLAEPDNQKKWKEAKSKTIEDARIALMSEEKLKEYEEREAKKRAVLEAAKLPPVPEDKQAKDEAKLKAEIMGIDDESSINPTEEVMDFNGEPADPIEVAGMMFDGIMKTADTMSADDKQFFLINLIDALKCEVMSEEIAK